jgi:hypothetical protein
LEHGGADEGEVLQASIRVVCSRQVGACVVSTWFRAC